MTNKNTTNKEKQNHNLLSNFLFGKRKRDANENFSSKPKKPCLKIDHGEKATHPKSKKTLLEEELLKSQQRKEILKNEINKLLNELENKKIQLQQAEYDHQKIVRQSAIVKEEMEIDCNQQEDIKKTLAIKRQQLAD